MSREVRAANKASATMVGNPPQTLPLEFRGDVTLGQQNKATPAKDCKTAKACVDASSFNHSPELSATQQPNNAPMPGSALTSTVKRLDKRVDVPKLKGDVLGVFPNPQWLSGAKGGRDESLNAAHSSAASGKKSSAQSAAFQCSTLFKPVQPVAFLPSPAFPASLCKIKLPPAPGEIAALRDATASQFQKDVQPQSSGVRGTPLTRTYPYSFSASRTPAAEKKTVTSTSKVKSKNTKPAEQHKSLASVVASPTIALPLQHPSLMSATPTCYTLSPTAAICCGITSPSRLLNHVDKGKNVDKAAVGPRKTPPPAPEDHTPSAIELRDVPLDLSAKSKRPKCTSNPSAAVMQPNNNNNELNQREFLNSKRNHSTNYSSAVQYPVLPNTQRNGSHQKQTNKHQKPQAAEQKATWGKGSSPDPVRNIPGTYVGVASPILASTLRGKDGKGTFADEFQSFAKQEFISIIDQGEHLASGGKKPSCVMKDSIQAHSIKHVKNTSTTISKSCPPRGALTTALSVSANAPTLQKAGPGRVASVAPSWQQSSQLPPQPSSLQGKNTQGSLKSKEAAVTDGQKLQNNQQSPSKPRDDKWERVKSPLSNLASIVKQQGVETAATTQEGNSHSSPVASKKEHFPSPLSGSQDVPSKRTSKFKYPSYWSVDRSPVKSSPEDSTDAIGKKRADGTKPLETSADPSADPSADQRQRLQAKQLSPSKPAGHRHLCGGNASTNGNRKESKLAQVLEGEVFKKDSSTPALPSTDRLEGAAASIPTGQSGGGDKSGKKANGTKEESPSKGKSSKQRSSSVKPVKNKSPTGSSKRAAGKKNDIENTPVKVPCSKKQKKRCSPALEQSLPAGQRSPPRNKLSQRDRISPRKAEQPNHKQTDGSGTGQDTPGCLKSSLEQQRESESSESSFPRLRRGRRRADEARLDLWGFATPSPPPPPPPAASPPAAVTPGQPPRRPRGRPRSTPLPELTLQGKGKVAEDEVATPPSPSPPPSAKKRQRCRSKKYQSGDYITERVKQEEGEHGEESDSGRQDTKTPADPQTPRCGSPAASSPDPPPRRTACTRSGSARYSENDASPDGNNKPSGKRKFKSKHLSDSDEQKPATKRNSLGKRAASLALDEGGGQSKRAASSPPSPPKSATLSPSNKRGSSRGSDSESPPKRPVPPEVRRLIVNKNAGETLLQRAARLGYQDVVQYCLEKDIREVNRRDNAGYTALHEASSRGWTQIVQMLLKHGADVNCSAQDGTRPLHDAVASDNLPIVWLLLNHGADPTLATYSGHTPVKLAHSASMKAFLIDYFTDLEGRKEEDPGSHWEFYSSSLFETEQEPCWDFLLSDQNQEEEEDQEAAVASHKADDADKDCLLFEFSSEPLLPCYHVQVSVTQGFCNWFLLTDVLKRLKLSARTFLARHPHMEVVSLLASELHKQVSVSQVSSSLLLPCKGKKEEKDEDEEEEEEGKKEEEQKEEEGLVELVRCVPELQRLLGSTIHILEEDEEQEEVPANTGKLCRR